MTRTKSRAPDYVEEAGRAAVAATRKRGPSSRDRAMAFTLAPRDPETDREAAVAVAVFALRGGWDRPEVRDVLDKLGLLPVREAVTVPPRRLAERPQFTGEPTKQQQEMAERIAVFAGHRAAGLNELDAARAMGISLKTARKYAEAIAGTGGAS